MSCLLQMCLFVAFIYWIHITSATPLLHGFSVEKNLKLNLKPLEFKPISFFKERWSPFGKFGVRKGIQKRDLEIVTSITAGKLPPPPPVPPAPVYEHVQEGKTNKDEPKYTETSITILSPGPDPVRPHLNPIRIPLEESFKLPTEGIYTNIGRNPLINNLVERTSPQMFKEIYGELPPRPKEPVPEQPVNFIYVPPVRPTSTSPPAQQDSPIPGIRYVSWQVVSSPRPVMPKPEQPIGFIPVHRVNQIPVMSFVHHEEAPLPKPVKPIPVQSISFIPAQPVTPNPTHLFFPVEQVTSPPPVKPISVQSISFIHAKPEKPNPITMFVPLEQVPPPQTVKPIPAQPIAFIHVQPVNPVPSEPVVAQEVVPLIKPPPSPPVNISEIPPTDGPFVKGSKKALYYGKVFLQLISQFLTSARLKFSQFSSQPPSPPPPA